MEPLEAAILRTVLYADVFDFPLTVPELHHYLIYKNPVAADQLQQTLAASTTLQVALKRIDNYVVCAGREAIVALREERERAARILWTRALRYGAWLARVPFVRMVAVTGSLSVRNPASAEDDLDYFLVTQPGRVWLARAGAIVLVYLGKLRGDAICPNYITDTETLAQTRQDLFMAREVTQMTPLFGFGVYERFRAENMWTCDYQPNATKPLYAMPEIHLDRWHLPKHIAECILSTGFGSTLEKWEFRRKTRKFKARAKPGHSTAVIDHQQVKGHFNDHGHPTLRRYQQLLEQYGLE